jgi:hypothetical protein
MGGVRMDKPNPSSLEWIELISILLFGSVGVVLAYGSRDLRYVAEAVGCSQFVAAFIAVVMCSAGLKGLRGRLLTIGILAVVVTSGIILLRDANGRLTRDNAALQDLSRQLSDKNAKLGILDVINREPRLIAADEKEISECFEPKAIVVEVSHQGKRIQWEGIASIRSRYRNVAHDWKLVSMHAHPQFRRINGCHAAVVATTYVYEPRRDEKWRRAMPEVWKLHRGRDGRWRILAFYYSIPPRDVGKYL